MTVLSTPSCLQGQLWTRFLCGSILSSFFEPFWGLELQGPSPGVLLPPWSGHVLF